jgi:rhamnosyltransferase
MRISAVATAFHPDDRLAEVVRVALQSCAEVIVVDNTPGGPPILTDGLSADSRVRVLRSGRNLGLAGALNLGVAALSPDADAVLFMDQDSILGEDLVAGLAVHLQDASVAIAAPAPWDEAQGRYYEPRAASGPEVADRDVVITSGMLVRRAVLDQVGSFREDFFVDHVDNDFCLRVRRAGFRIVRDRRLKLPHSLGQRNQHRLPGVTLSSSRHPTWRLYWIARNGTILIREHKRDFSGWALGTGVYLVRWFLLRTLIEQPRRERAGVILRGFSDGLRGRLNTAYLPDGASHPELTR